MFAFVRARGANSRLDEEVSSLLRLISAGWDLRNLAEPAAQPKPPDLWVLESGYRQ
jgi:hypothetical protein